MRKKNEKENLIDTVPPVGILSAASIRSSAASAI